MNLADLPLGWSASRKSKDEPWQREKKIIIESDE
jgi:hypothetical protein